MVLSDHFNRGCILLQPFEAQLEIASFFSNPCYQPLVLVDQKVLGRQFEGFEKQ